ncbi:MAG TPA: GGDEF domain-containing protein [Ramlibacter sp.]|nr:GGDEF domain-containing protein [Ramlibacter sp.]
MESVAVGFWGAYFGALGLCLAAALVAFTRSARRVAMTGALAASLSALYVLAFVGWLPVDGAERLMRLQAQLAAVCAAVLGLLLLRLLGLLRGGPGQRIVATAGVAAAGVILLGWWIDPAGALALGVALQSLFIALGLAAAVRSARLGAPLGWLSVAGIACMSVSIAVLTWHAFGPERTPWAVHALGALAGIAYAACMAAALWVRYRYLIDVREAMEHGPSFDPITRLPSPFETGLRLAEAFARAPPERPLALVVVSIANLEALEHLHGRWAFNHGLFICANRLRRLGAEGIELGRVGDDAFLLLVHRPPAAEPLIELAQQVARRLARPVVLATSQDMAALESGTTEWVADVGVGLLLAGRDMKPATALAAARAMSRTAWSYPTRVATYDPEAREIAELMPQAVPAR